MAFEIERHIEAALLQDGFLPDIIISKMPQIRGILFYHHRLLSESTLSEYQREVNADIKNYIKL